MGTESLVQAVRPSAIVMMASRQLQKGDLKLLLLMWLEGCEILYSNP